jgi:hypothetical protein
MPAVYRSHQPLTTPWDPIINADHPLKRIPIFCSPGTASCIDLLPGKSLLLTTGSPARRESTDRGRI